MTCVAIYLLFGYHKTGRQLVKRGPRNKRNTRKGSILNVNRGRDVAPTTATGLTFFINLIILMFQFLFGGINETGDYISRGRRFLGSGMS
jgi:hypothetical protein